MHFFILLWQVGWCREGGDEMRNRVIPVDTKHVLKPNLVKDVLHFVLVCNHAFVVFIMCLKIVFTLYTWAPACKSSSYRLFFYFFSRRGYYSM